jgi:hypothetical protein
LHRTSFRTGSYARRLALALVTAAGLLAAPAARAQSNGALAEKLFLDGTKLMEAGQYAQACPKFADSQRLDPAIGTLMHLAQCHEKTGKFASAWSEYTDAAAQAQKAGQSEREKYCRDHATALDAKLQKVIVELSHPPDGTTIKLDGTTLPPGVLGTEIPLDPGDHKLEVGAPGKKTWRQDQLNLGPSAVVTRVQVTLEDDPNAAPGGAASAKGSAAVVGVSTGAGTGTGTGQPPRPEQPVTSGMPTKRLIGYGVGGVGIVSIGIAVAEELTSIGRNNDLSQYPAGTPERQQVSDESSQAQMYAIIFGGVGLAAVGTGLYLVLTSNDAPATATPAGSVRVTPLVGRGLAGAGVNFAW